MTPSDTRKRGQEFIQIIRKGFDRFVDKVLTESQAHDVKIIEDFSDLKAENVKNEIIENAQDTITLLDSYVDDLDVNNLDKNRLKTMLKGLYVEASNMEM